MSASNAQGQRSTRFDEKASLGYHVSVDSSLDQGTNAERAALDARRAWIAPALAFAAYLAGIALRYLFILVWNRATEKECLFSDAFAYYRSASDFCNPAYVPNICDTIFPPGGKYYFGVLMQMDPSMELAMHVQFLLSCMIPLLLYATAFRLFGRRHALFALGFSSLYFPLWEYSSYFLSEGPFLFLMLLSFYLLIRSLQAEGPTSAWLWGLAAGLTLGFSSAFKSLALVSALLVFAALLALYRRFKIRIWPTMSASTAGLLMVLTVISAHATKLNEGRFLLIANDAPRNFLLGHHGRVGFATFTDEKRHFFHEFGCPVAAQRGYKDVIRLNVGVYEGAEQYRMAIAWMKEHPAEAFLQSIEHAFDLFVGSVPWPGSVRNYLSWSIFFCEVFLVLLLFPAGIHLVRYGREMLRLHPRFCADLLVVLPVFSVFLVAFLFVGEPRYRIPYDAFMILLASRLYCGVREGDKPFMRGLEPGKPA